MITYFFLRYLMKSPDCGRRVEADCVRNVHEFDHVEPALPGFEEGYVGLITAQFLGHLHLGQVSSFALLNDQFD